MKRKTTVEILKTILIISVILTITPLTTALQADSESEELSIMPGQKICGGIVITDYEGNISATSDKEFLRLAEGFIENDDEATFIPYQLSAHRNSRTGDYKATITIADEKNSTIEHEVIMSVENELTMTIKEKLEEAKEHTGIIYAAIAGILVLITAKIFTSIMPDKKRK